MECVLKCEIQTNAKEWNGLDKFGDAWDTTI